MPALIRLVMTVCLLGGWLVTAGAADEERYDSINVAYANILGTGVYEIGDRRAFVLNIPIEFPLSRPQGEDWSVNLLLPVTVGVLDVDWSDWWDDALDGERLQTVGFTPGVEIDFAVTDNWHVKPYLQAGYIFDVKDDHDAWFYMAGVSTLASYPLGDYTIGLGAGLKLAEQRPVSIGDKTGIGVIDLGVDVRRTLNAQFRGESLQMSVYAIASRYFNDLDLLDISDDAFHIKNTYEFGLTLGVERPLPLFGIDWQRLGVGYKFGDGIKSITFNLGFPF